MASLSRFVSNLIKSKEDHVSEALKEAQKRYFDACIRYCLQSARVLHDDCCRRSTAISGSSSVLYGSVVSHTIKRLSKGARRFKRHF